MREDPTFEPNRDFGKTRSTSLVGIVWQTCLTSLPIFLVLRAVGLGLGGICCWPCVTSVFIKFNWYDKLPPRKPT